jgi:hypothetical protein
VNNPQLHPEVFVSDKGSEFKGAWHDWQDAEEASLPGFYKHRTSPGTWSSFNSWTERAIATVRRFFARKYRKVEHEWNTAPITPVGQRRFRWTEYIKEAEQELQTNHHQTLGTTPLKTIRQQGVTLPEIADRIREKARKRYGNRVDGLKQPGFRELPARARVLTTK